MAGGDEVDVGCEESKTYTLTALGSRVMEAIHKRLKRGYQRHQLDSKDD